MSTQPSRPMSQREPEPVSGTAPPVLLYLPALARSPKNSASRIAELMAIRANSGPGVYATEELRGVGAHLSDGRRIVAAGSGPVLDVYALDYRTILEPPAAAGTGVLAAVRRFLLAVWYFLRIVVLVLSARKRAKSRVAKWQLVIGFGAAVLLMASAVSTFFAVLAALEVWDEPGVSGTAADAVALGFTAVTTWLFVRLRPVVDDAAQQIAQLIEYVENETGAAAATVAVERALDDLLEADPGRTVHVFGYSFGALVAIDFLYPRSAQYPRFDPRHADAISAFVTAGCPIDVVRLYVPDYLDGRVARIPGLPWTNVYIAADVFGSNLVDGSDFVHSGEAAAGPSAGTLSAVTIAGEPAPVSLRYTNERLTFRTIWGRRGFLSHGGYWDAPEHGNCLHLVMAAVLNR